jgi:hypothetical protein
VIADYKKPNGDWAKAQKLDGVTHQTTSGVKWFSMKRRCNDSKYHESHPTYIGTTVSFVDFQDFTDWHIKQVGYGRGFQLDKDLLVKGNTDYNRHSCVLLPAELNGLINTHKAARGGLPIGVTKTANGQRLIATLGTTGRQNTLLGVCDSQEEAFKLYAVAKEAFIKAQADKWKDFIDHRAYAALKAYRVCIDD